VLQDRCTSNGGVNPPCLVLVGGKYRVGVGRVAQCPSIFDDEEVSTNRNQCQAVRICNPCFGDVGGVGEV